MFYIDGFVIAVPTRAIVCTSVIANIGSKAFLPMMLAQREGCLVNISSVFAG